MAHQRRVTVGRGEGVVAVAAQGHTWIALAGPGGELAREEGGAPQTTFAAPPGDYAVTTDGHLTSVRVRALEPLPEAEVEGPPAGLRLTSDAPDEHVVDGIGELPADGQSSCRIAVEKVDFAGEPLRGRRDTDEVFLRTTGGLLQDARGRRVRSVRLREGRAEFRLVAEDRPRLVTVEAFGHAPLQSAELRLEFV